MQILAIDKNKNPIDLLRADLVGTRTVRRC